MPIEDFQDDAADRQAHLQPVIPLTIAEAETRNHLSAQGLKTVLCRIRIILDQTPGTVWACLGGGGHEIRYRLSDRRGGHKMAGHAVPPVPVVLNLLGTCQERESHFLTELQLGPEPCQAPYRGKALRVLGVASGTDDGLQ